MNHIGIAVRLHVINELNKKKKKKKGVMNHALSLVCFSFHGQVYPGPSLVVGS
jgi:hypothetical protein